ncbi:MAG: lectin, partial [Pseudolabrys sp.]
MNVRICAPLAACLTLLVFAPAQAQQASMTFFVTSVGLGKGADLGGLAGADRH